MKLEKRLHQYTYDSEVFEVLEKDDIVKRIDLLDSQALVKELAKYCWCCRGESGRGTATMDITTGEVNMGFLRCNEFNLEPKLGIVVAYIDTMMMDRVDYSDVLTREELARYRECGDFEVLEEEFNIDWDKRQIEYVVANYDCLVDMSSIEQQLHEIYTEEV